MRIIYYTSGISGSGRIVRGIAIGNALKRNKINCEFIIINSSPFANLCDRLNIRHIDIPTENSAQLSKKNFKDSILYRTITDIKPDIIIVDLLWFSLYHFIDELKCKKIFLCRQVDNRFFSMDTNSEPIVFNSSNYDLVLAIEPFISKIPFSHYINPIVMRNKDEIFKTKDALTRLKINNSNKNCLIAYNGHPGDFDKIIKTYSYIEDSGYNIVSTTNYKGGIFPIVDYFNAFDLIICGGGYNSFWEAVYFKKEAIFIVSPTIFENQNLRVNENREHYFEENGADQLVDIIMHL